MYFDERRKEEYVAYNVKVFLKSSRETLDIEIWVKNKPVLEDEAEQRIEEEKTRKELLKLARKSTLNIKKTTAVFFQEEEVTLQRTTNTKMSTGPSAYFKREYCLSPMKKQA